jgi:hypothetical protein
MCCLSTNSRLPRRRASRRARGRPCGGGRRLRTAPCRARHKPGRSPLTFAEQQSCLCRAWRTTSGVALLRRVPCGRHQFRAAVALEAAVRAGGRVDRGRAHDGRRSRAPRHGDCRTRPSEDRRISRRASRAELARSRPQSLTGFRAANSDRAWQTRSSCECARSSESCSAPERLRPGFVARQRLHDDQPARSEDVGPLPAAEGQARGTLLADRALTSRLLAQ